MAKLVISIQAVRTQKIRGGATEEDALSSGVHVHLHTHVHVHTPTQKTAFTTVKIQNSATSLASPKGDLFIVYILSKSPAKC